MKKLSQKIQEAKQNKSEADYDYGCLMVMLELDRSQFRPFAINKFHLYDDETNQFGEETEPHVTILYGIHDSYSETDILKWIRKNITEPIDIKLDEISLFENPNKEYDVVKWDVKSEQLHKLNEKLKKDFKFTSDFPDYHPHATLFYTKKGMGKNYIKKKSEIEPIKIEANLLKWSPPTGPKIYVQIVNPNSL